MSQAKQELWDKGCNLYQKMIAFENANGEAIFDVNGWLICNNNPFASEYISVMKAYFAKS